MKVRMKALRGVKLIKERGINLAKLRHTVIPAKVATLSRKNFVAQPINIKKTWAAKFYALASPDEFGQRVPIRGRQVVITPTRVNDYLRIGELELMTPWDFRFQFELDVTFGVPEEFVEELREFPRGEWDQSTSVLNHRELGAESAFWNIFQQHSLLPISKNQEHSPWELKTLKSIYRGERFNVGLVIYSRLEEAFHVIKPNRLIFSSLINFYANQLVFLHTWTTNWLIQEHSWVAGNRVRLTDPDEGSNLKKKKIKKMCSFSPDFRGEDADLSSQVQGRLNQVFIWEKVKWREFWAPFPLQSSASETIWMRSSSSSRRVFPAWRSKFEQCKHSFQDISLHLQLRMLHQSTRGQKSSPTMI